MKKLTKVAMVMVFIGFWGIVLADVFGLIPASVSNFLNPFPTRTPLPLARHEILSDNQVEPIWVIDKVYVLWDRMGKTLDAAAGRVCYLGNFGKSDKYDRVTCIDSLTGEVLWHNVSGGQINVTADGVFIIFSKPTGVRKYDLQNGNLIWRKSLSGSGTTYLNVIDNQIQVLGVPDFLWILDKNGKKIGQEANRRIFLSTPDKTFVNFKGIQAYQTGTTRLIWEYIDLSLIRNPLFTNDKIFVRGGDWQGSAYALDRETGKRLWISSSTIISGLAYSPEKHLVYALRGDGDLLAIDENTGKESTIVKFSSVPFVVAGMDSENYQVAYDNEQHVITVSLGDSRQLFAFQEK